MRTPRCKDHRSTRRWITTELAATFTFILIGVAAITVVLTEGAHAPSVIASALIFGISAGWLGYSSVTDAKRKLADVSTCLFCGDPAAQERHDAMLAEFNEYVNKRQTEGDRLPAELFTVAGDFPINDTAVVFPPHSTRLTQPRRIVADHRTNELHGMRDQPITDATRLIQMRRA